MIDRAVSWLRFSNFIDFPMKLVFLPLKLHSFFYEDGFCRSNFIAFSMKPVFCLCDFALRGEFPRAS
jgi:hypothetical protein